MDELAWGDIEGYTINADMLLEDEPCEDCCESQYDADCECMCHTPVMVWDELGADYAR